MGKLLGIQESADLLGVSKNTIRRWDLEGRLRSERTQGGHRRFDVAKLLNTTGEKKDNRTQKTIGYARVSSHDQKEDLKRQQIVLEGYCGEKGFDFEIIADLGSGMNYRKKGLSRLIKMICSCEVDRLVLTHKDRLLRFGSDLIFSLCEIFGCEVIIINKSSESTFEEDLASDVLEIITVFSARLYGSRSHKNKDIVKKLQQVAKEI